MAFIDSSAYNAAIARNIRENSRKGKGQRWLAEVADRKELIEKMYASTNPFIDKMLNSYHEWGTLTVNQEAAVRKVFDKMIERKAEYAAKTAVDAATSKHVGTVGDRQTWELTVRSVFSFETNFGMTYIHIMADKDGNVVVHKGTHQGLERGDVVKGKATIKEHGEREGVKQTIISRPKFEKVIQLQEAA